MARRTTRDRTAPPDTTIAQPEAPIETGAMQSQAEAAQTPDIIPPVSEHMPVPEEIPAADVDRLPAAPPQAASDESPWPSTDAPSARMPDPPSPEPARTWAPEPDQPTIAMPLSAPLSPPRRSGGTTFAGVVLGGALAAAAGAAAVLYLGPGYFGAAEPSAQQIKLLGSVKTQGDELAALKKTVALLSEAPPATDRAALDALGAKLADLAKVQIDLAARLDDADARLTALETRPAPSPNPVAVSGANIAEVQKLLETQRAEAEAAQAKLAAAAADAETRIKAAEAEATRLKAESEAAAKLARTRAAISHLQAALESGGPIQPALDELTALGMAIPQALADQSGGVPSLDALKAAFPPAAREALALSLRETAGTGTFDRFLAFLRVESGARSLTPRAGDDPDAVLSRAESALAADDLPAAITEIGALPAPGQARMAEWVALAQRRLDAVQAVNSLNVAD